MKRFLKITLCLICLVFASFGLTACDLFSGDSGGDNTANAPTEISVTGVSTEIMVGQSLYTRLKVQQKVGEEWEEVPQADYKITCNYDATKYGTFEFKVNLREYPKIEFKTNIVVNPIQVTLPTFSVVYTGELVDAKSNLEEFAYFPNSDEKLFEVISYENRTNVGNYSAKVRLLNPDKYMWSDGTQNLSGRTQTVNWSITQAPKKSVYGNSTNLTVYYGDTLLDVIQDNLLNYENGRQIDFAFIDESGEVVSTNIVITNQTVLFARFRPNSNYEYNDTLSFNLTIVPNAYYKVEHYKLEGGEYVLATTETFNARITSVVSATAKTYDGYTLNSDISTISGRVVKGGSLVLKLYYDN